MNNVNQFNPFGIDTPMAEKKVLKETSEYAIADSHIFAIVEIPYPVTDESTKYKPNWQLVDMFGDGSLCQKADTSILDNKIYKRYKYQDLLENNELCEQCKKVLIEYFKQ